MKYEGKELRGYTKEEMEALCSAEGIDTTDLSRGAMMKALLAIEDSVEEPAVAEEQPVEEPVVDNGARLAYERELARRMGGRVADTYEQELARRRGAGTRLSGADAVAMEIARRRKCYGGK